MTQNKTFEEQFPSLIARHWSAESITRAMETREFVENPIWFNHLTIQEHCLDKQKVRDALEKSLKTCVCQNCLNWKRRIEEELEL